MINLWQLHVFLVVDETGSFSAAAGRLHMTQPGVSQQIRSLESYLGTKLFVRRGHGVELTAAGLDLRDPARRLLNLSENTELTLMARRGEVSGRVRLGCSLLSGPYIFAPWIGSFRHEYPDVSVQIEQMEPGPLIGAMRAQEVDGGVVLGRMRGRGLVHHKLLDDPITLIVPLNHAWTRSGDLARAAAAAEDASHDGLEGASAARSEDEVTGPAVKPSMLKEQPLVMEHALGESHSDARRALTDALEERGVLTRDLKVVLELPGPMAVACAVSEGLGAGFVPLSIARRLVGQIVPVRLEGLTLAQHVYLIHDRKALRSPAAQAWWKFIGAQAATRQAPAPSVEEVTGPDAPIRVRPVEQRVVEIQPAQ